MNKFFNLPFQATTEDYQEILDSIIELAKENPSVSAIYLMGGKWFPGISDLDVVLVYRDAKNPLKSSANLTEKSGRIFTHRYLAFSEKDFKNFFFFYPTSQIKLIYGQDLKITDPNLQYNENQYKILLILNLIDYLIHKMAILPFRYRNETKIDVRKRIAELKSIAYDFEIIEKLGISHSNQVFLGEVKKMRENWFVDEEKSLRNLIELSKQSQRVIFNLVKLIETYLNNNFEMGELENICFKNRSFNIKFINEYSEKDFQKNKIGLKIPIIKGGRVSLNFPLVMSVYFSFFSNYENTNLGNLINNSLSKNCINIKKTDLINSYVRAKVDLFDRFVQSNGFYRAPFILGFSGFDLRNRPKSLLVSRILSIFNQ